MKVNNVVTINQIELSYRAFIQKALIQLGLSPTNKGTYYLRDLIILALQKYNFNDNDINLTDLIQQLSNQKHISTNTIKSNIDYAFRYKDNAKAEENFEKIFNIKYDTYYITAKSIINLIVSLIYLQQLSITK